MAEQIWIVIPARYGSRRFPGKPLAQLRGRPMIAWVLEACRRVPGIAEVVVATDDQRIADAVGRFGGRVEMTSADHRSGTERVAEIARRNPGIEWFINVQGDEPGIEPELVAAVAGRLMREHDAEVIVTAAAPLNSHSEFNSPHVVKVVADLAGRALYFSRAPIPFADLPEGLPTGVRKHLGIYAYSGLFLRGIDQQLPGRLAAIEDLEQLNWLENGYSLAIVDWPAAWPGIDTPAELETFAAQWPGPAEGTNVDR